MKSIVVALVSTLALSANAQLSYNATTKSIACPVAAGKFCVGPASGLIVTCANGVGTLSLCGGAATCAQTSPSTGDAVCSTGAKYTNSTGPWVVDAASEDCDCEKPVPPHSSSSAPPPPRTSSTPVGPVLTSSRPANTSTPCTTTTPSSAPSSVPPVTPSSTPAKSSSTLVGPVVASSKPTSAPSTWTRSGTGTGYPQSTSKVTTLNSSWKPTPSSTASTASRSASSTVAAPVLATGGAASGRSVHALAIGLAGVIAVLA